MAKAKRNSKKVRNKRPETIPPGATKQAADRLLDRGDGAPGSGAGPRHASGDPGSAVESFGPADTNQPLGDTPLTEEPEPLEEGPPYAGISGGAVGGTPAQGRASGGRIRHGIEPGGAHRGDSTIGNDPGSGTE